MSQADVGLGSWICVRRHFLMKVVFLCIIIQRFHLSHKVPHPTLYYYTRANRRRIHPNGTIRRRICPKALSFTMPITQGLTPDPTSEDGSFLHNILQKDITLSASSSRAKDCVPPSGPLAIRLRGPAPDHPPLYTHPHIYTPFLSRVGGVCPAR